MRLNSPERNSTGELIAEVLTQAWRSDPPPPLEISSDKLERIAPLLLKSGAAALAWRRIRDTDLCASPTANEFHQAYRFQTLQARIDQRKIEQVFKLLRSVQVEPILVKGWAVARLYPEQGLRPYGDIDVCVREELSATAEAALKTAEARQYLVDLHKGFAKLGGGDTDALYARSQLVRLGETDVRVLGPEDHLRVLCFHLLREGAWRPLWLCDIAVALESRPANFDWDRCFAGIKRSRELVFCAIGLAHCLLGADVCDIPSAESVEQLPAWAVPTVLSEWASPHPSMTRRHLAPMTTYWDHPSGVLEGLRNRWPNPVEATIVAGGSFNDRSRLPLQIRSYLAHATGFLTRLLKLLRVRNE